MLCLRPGVYIKRALALFTLCALLFVPCTAAADDGAVYLAKLRPEAGAAAEEPFVSVDAAELRRLLQDDLVVWYEEDTLVSLPDASAPLVTEESPGSLTVTAPRLYGTLSPWYEDRMWHLDLIGAAALYDAGFTGAGVRVGIIDSGVSEHEALAGRLAPGRNFIDGSDDTTDTYGHGTHVAGLIAGRTDTGCIGTAPDATLVPLKCFNEKNTLLSLIAKAIYAAVDEFDCDIINMSLGFTSNSTAMAEAVNYAASKGVLVVSAAGNGGGSTVYYPAGYDSAIGVGSITSSGLIAARSNHNESVFIAAPGHGVITTHHNGGYTQVSGTSFAVPVVSGAAAALKSACPDLSPDELCEILASTATDAGAVGRDDYYGWGILNLAGAAAALPQGIRIHAEDDGTVRVSNHSDADLSALLIAAQHFRSGRAGATQVFPLTLPAGASVSVTVSPNATVLYLTDPDFVPLTAPVELP